MSVATAAASAASNKAEDMFDGPGGLAGYLASENNPSMAALLRKAKRRKAKRATSSLSGAVGQAAQAVGGDNGRLDTIESRLEALEGGTEGDVTQPSPTVNVPSTPDEGMGAAPAMPEPTMGAAEKMFGGGAIRQLAMGAGKFKK